MHEVEDRRIGDCHEAAFRFLQERRNDPNLVMVQALVTGVGRVKGIKFAHSFVLDTKRNLVFEVANGKRTVLPKDIYYSIGNVVEYGRYSFLECVDKILESPNWVWNEELGELDDRSYREITESRRDSAA